MTKPNTEKQTNQPEQRKLFPIMTIPYIILIINGFNLVNEFFTNSEYAVRAIDVFMLVMAVIAVALVAVNTVKYYKEKNEAETK